ncbi:MAG: hypothetical protein KAV82_01550 [Phycisphaerae bacterium]|nr:hypothetical protein [Phycisphaerae bacterium]
MTASAPPEYLGVCHMHEDVSTALHILANGLAAKTSECETHTVLEVTGFHHKETLLATAVYLVGAIAQCIQADLEIRKALFDETTLRRDVIRDVQSVIGGESVDDDFRKKTRDPWFLEGMSHLVIHLARTDLSLHPVGTVLVKTQLKYDVNDHGLDLIAIYDSDGLGITAGEAKAYLDDPTQAIIDASTRLREIDDALRDTELRAAVTQLRSSLSHSQQARLGHAFWRSERSYYPFVCCDAKQSRDWGRKRNSLRKLAVPVSHKFLVPIAFDAARDVFDELSRLMRAYASGNLTQ